MTALIVLECKLNDARRAESEAYDRRHSVLTDITKSVNLVRSLKKAMYKGLISNRAYNIAKYDLKLKLCNLNNLHAIRILEHHKATQVHSKAARALAIEKRAQQDKAEERQAQAILNSLSSREKDLLRKYLK